MQRERGRCLSFFISLAPPLPLRGSRHYESKLSNAEDPHKENAFKGERLRLYEGEPIICKKGVENKWKNCHKRKGGSLKTLI